MGASDSFDDLRGRLQGGDERAASEVFRRYAGRLIALARTKLDARVRAKVDPEDVLQSVFRSFFRRHADGQFELDDWESLWSLLVRITVRKCRRTSAAYFTELRDVRRELSRAQVNDDDARWREIFDPEPSPDEVAALSDTIESLMRRFNEKQRQILLLRLQGCTVAEISQEIGRTERTVHRVLEQARDVLRRAAGEPLAG